MKGDPTAFYAFPLRSAAKEFFAADIEARVLAKATGQLDHAIERRKAIAIEAMLYAYAHANNWVEGAPVESLRPEYVFRIAEEYRAMRNGEEVPRLAAARAKKRTRPVRANEALRDAAIYVRAATNRDGGDDSLAAHIADPDPIETVRAAFGMNERRQVTNVLHEKQFERLELSGVLAGRPNSERAEHIRLCMAKAGEGWKVVRSAKAGAYAADKRRS